MKVAFICAYRVMRASDSVPTAEEVMDRFSGMITKDQAAALAGKEVAEKPVSSDVINVDALLQFISMKRDSQPASANPYSVNVQDYLYRIFNPVMRAVGNRQVSRRYVVLGREGCTIRLDLVGKLSEFIDINAFERQDLVVVKKALLDVSNGELVDGKGTMISRIAPTRHETITDYSMLKDGARNVDVIGRVVEIGPVRHVSGLSANGQVAVSDCVLTDMDMPVSASLWGSSAIATTRMKVNDFVKMEFCNARVRNGSMELYANDLSRVVANSSFARKLDRE